MADATKTLESCIESLIRKADDPSNASNYPPADNALKFSQAACNVANAMRVLWEMKKG